MEKPSIFNLFNYWIYLKSPPYQKLLYDKYFNNEVYDLVTKNKSTNFILEQINKSKFVFPFFKNNKNSDSLCEKVQMEKSLLLNYYTKVYFSLFSMTIVTFSYIYMLKKANFNLGLVRYYIKNNRSYRRLLIGLYLISFLIIALANIKEKGEDEVINNLSKAQLNIYKKLV